jgi:hypothetical protein
VFSGVFIVEEVDGVGDKVSGGALVADVQTLLVASMNMFLRFTMCNGPTNALIHNKTLIQMSYIKIFKTTPTCFSHQLIIIRELI